MKRIFGLLAGCFSMVVAAIAGNEAKAPPFDDSEVGRRGPAPIGQIGQIAEYRLERHDGVPGSVVTHYSLALGPIEHRASQEYQWMVLQAIKASGDRFSVWLLATEYPAQSLINARQSIARYLVAEGKSRPVEFRNRQNGAAVLPSLGGWQYLIPHAFDDRSGRTAQAEVFPERSSYLGHPYRRVSLDTSETAPMPPRSQVLTLQPNVLIGLPHNTRQRDETRRYDTSDYELVRLAQDDYHEMIDAGMNCLRVDADQVPWIERENVFYWGVGGRDVPYPECLYRSNYLGPALFFDEPAVGTRDHVIRPRLAKDDAYRIAIDPQRALEEFKSYFNHALHEGAPTRLLRGLRARDDVNLGTMSFVQENLYSWETMVSTAAYQLSQDPRTPSAIVFEPPGRVGTRRTLPEMNMTYGCQIPTDDPKNLTAIIYGFLRGAARLTDKSWGMSVYGAVDRTDAFWFQTHAYDLGARLFFFWDSYQLACVPFSEALALARNLRNHETNHPQRDLDRLKLAAEIAILLPPGYNLGHVHLGKGSLWGVGELNLERRNRNGIKYRKVMANFFSEIERCLRFGVAFDLLWDLPGIQLNGFREVIRIREDGKVEIHQGQDQVLLNHARRPTRPSGAPPKLDVSLTTDSGRPPLKVTARARVTEVSAPVYYTLGADTEGVYHNAVVAWELYGPNEEDYRFLRPAALKPTVRRQGADWEVTTEFNIDRPGEYRLRVATVDLAGRTTVVWKRLTAGL